MTNRDELIKKYNRRQLTESEKKEFDAFMESDEAFAADVYLAAQLTAARHAKLQDSVADDSKKRVQRLWQYAGIAALLLLGIIIYFLRQNKTETPLKAAFDVPIVKEKELKRRDSLIKQDSLRRALADSNALIFNEAASFRLKLKESKEPRSKPKNTPSVQKPKKASEKLKIPTVVEDSLYLQAFIAKRKGKEKNAGKSQDDWRTLLFSDQYFAALTAIRQEIPVTTDGISLNKLHLYGGILNASIPEGNRQEAIDWLKAVIDNGDYADYAATFLIKTYMELNQIEAAKKLLAQYPDVKAELPLSLQKRL